MRSALEISRPRNFHPLRELSRKLRRQIRCRRGAQKEIL